MSALWFLARGSGLAAAVLLAAVLLLGIARVERWQRSGWPSLLTSHLHRRLSAALVAVVVVHVVAVILDGYAPVAAWDSVVPFLSDYRRIWTGLGTISLDGLMAVVVTSSLMRVLGHPVWRAFHWLSYALAPIVLLHALGDGSDARSPWAVALLVAVGLGAVAGPLWRLAGRTLGDGSVELAARLGAAVVAISALAAIVAFAVAGPFQTGWARAAGTPATLLGAATEPASDDGHSLPIGIDDRLDGSRTAASGSGVTVSLVDARDPSITVVVTTGGASPGVATVDITRGRISVCYGTPVIAAVVRFGCGQAVVTLTMALDSGQLSGALITAQAR